MKTDKILKRPSRNNLTAARRDEVPFRTVNSRSYQNNEALDEGGVSDQNQNPGLCRGTDSVKIKKCCAFIFIQKHELLL